MTQTAVEWLFDRMVGLAEDYDDGKINYTNYINGVKHFLDQAKEMEKQQIIDAYEQGSDDEIVAYDGTRKYKNGVEYYTFTYGSKGSDETLKDYHIVDTNEMVSSQTEISDEEIEKAMWEHFSDEYADMWSERLAFRLACKWYREQLKQKQ